MGGVAASPLTHSILKFAQNTDRPNHDQGDADADPDRRGRRVPAEADKTDADADEAEGNEIGEYLVEHDDMLTRKSICWICGRSRYPLERRGISFLDRDDPTLGRTLVDLVAMQNSSVEGWPQSVGDKKAGFLLKSYWVCLVCVGDPMFKYLAPSNPILQKWQTWLRDQFVGDVPPEDAFCEFECEKTECQFAHWETCERRLAYLDLIGKAQSGDASSPKAE
jgi:hypothetical protein